VVEGEEWASKYNRLASKSVKETHMPNGGVQPSCFVCKWAIKNTSKSPQPSDNNPLIEPIECPQNGFAVWLPSSHVCTKLGDPYDGSGLSTFSEEAGLESGSIYAWLEFGYRTKEHPSMPQYHHELVKLASFHEFAGWTLEQKQSVYSQARTKKEQELLRQPKSDGPCK
jgi:hypothetical protein